MNTLALDLGSHCGYAYNIGDSFFCGTWDLATPKEITEQGKQRGDRRGDIRVYRLLQNIRELLRNYSFDYLVFEDVLFSSSRMQTQLWASFRTAVWLADDTPNSEMRIDCVPVTTLKRFAGHGAADKNMMARFLCKADNRFVYIGKINPKLFFRQSMDQLKPIDDNCVDAVWIHRWAKHNLSRS